jgi:glycosyltransferase involved in cell wall biosynthesis
MPGWQREIVEHNRCGILVEPDNVTMFADRLVDLLASPQRMATYGRNARRAAETLFARDVLANQLEEVLMRACVGHEHREGVTSADQPHSVASIRA